MSNIWLLIGKLRNLLVTGRHKQTRSILIETLLIKINLKMHKILPMGLML